MEIPVTDFAFSPPIPRPDPRRVPVPRPDPRRVPVPRPDTRDWTDRVPRINQAVNEGRSAVGRIATPESYLTNKFPDNGGPPTDQNVKHPETLLGRRESEI